jgi:imidazoleglycerol-phosphate dehydratase/histidinol-phosphatase
MRKILFIDRDGTLILEPEDYQIDRIEKLIFYPGVFKYLSKIAQWLNYELVMVSNQDGLGTASYPEETFTPIQNLIIRTLESEGVHFSKIHIDKSFPEENQDTRKPKIGMLKEYFSEDVDLSRSYVIGDRLTDIQMAKNLGCQAIQLSSPIGTSFNDRIPEELSAILALTTDNWQDIWKFLSGKRRTAQIVRKTKETDIQIKLNLDEIGSSNINTGLGFFDHMLDQLALHSGVKMEIIVKGDLNIDEHHTIEDTAIALGSAFAEAIGSKMGMTRYGYCLPMDDCLAQAAIDFGGRPWLIWKVKFKREFIGDVPTELFYHFFKSFSDAARINLNIKAKGENEHHKIEAIFKAVARSMKMALRIDFESTELPSTKGIL